MFCFVCVTIYSVTLLLYRSGTRKRGQAGGKMHLLAGFIHHHPMEGTLLYNQTSHIIPPFRGLISHPNTQPIPVMLKSFSAEEFYVLWLVATIS